MATDRLESTCAAADVHAMCTRHDSEVIALKAKWEKTVAPQGFARVGLRGFEPKVSTRIHSQLRSSLLNES